METPKSQTTETKIPEVDYINFTEHTGHYDIADTTQKDTCYTFWLPEDLKFKDKMRISFILSEEYSQYIAVDRHDPLRVAEQVLSEMEEHYLYNPSLGELKSFVKFLEDNEVKNRKRFLNYSIKLAEYNIEKCKKELALIK
ncbi:unnamed protein product [marine sediment metagenome]|uniref:Uncharacterized protein n=1 Tax=marine sediment metagenome TaxID=412755 RepID=X1FPB6_9ZZZZ